MPYFREIKTLLIHIPKTGGSSIEVYFCNKFNVKLNYINFYSNMNLLYNNHSLQHCTYKELYNDKQFDINFDDIKIITVVRNPYERIISDLFFYKLIRLDMSQNEIYEQIRLFIESDDIKYDNHKLPQYLYLINNDDIIEKNIIIMNTETLTTDMINNKYYDFDMNINVTHRNKIDYISLLNNNSIYIINNYYIKDFMYFNYKKISINIIDIGITGCASINNQLIQYKRYHLIKNYNTNHKYIIWLINPINRFVSTFNYSYYEVSTNLALNKEFDFKNFLIPGRMKNSLERNYVFSIEYDRLLKFFNSPHHLAESLSSDDTELQQKAINLMNYKEEHLYKGINSYLNNVDFIKENYSNIIYVGRTENICYDINKLSTVLEIKLDENIKPRKNNYKDKSLKYMSPLAIKNIIEWYKDTDYRALKELCNYNLINNEILSSYFIYNE